MANTYKNIVITPNISTNASVVPMIQFSGGDATTNTDINLRVYTTQSGTLSFEGSAGQLFSITNDLTNSIFSVNDVSGIPSIDVYANGDIYLAPFGGRVGLGITPTTLPTANLHLAGNLFVTQNNASSLDVTGEIAEFGHNANNYAQVHVRNANTQQGASGDIVVTADIGTDAADFIDLGLNNSGFSSPVWNINAARDGYLYTANGNLAIGAANVSRIVNFFTSGTGAVHERMRIGQGVSIGSKVDPGANNLVVNGNVILTGATAGLGYGTGAGGIVSQATSKVTGVTLNKLVGAVAANSAALASNTVASFTVTNNLVAATDTVLVNRLNGGTAGAYHIFCDSVAAGSFVISMRNLSTGSLSERVVIGFAVIKAVQA